MSIDWFTVAAQIINFLILLWLLKRFLYGPIVAAMDAREREIVSRQSEAETARQAAVESQEKLEAERRRLADARDALMAGARDEARAERARLVDAARAEINDNRQAWLDSLERDRGAIVAALRARASDAVADVARATLADVARADLEPNVVAVFLERLAELPDEDRDRFAAACSQSEDAIVVSTPSDLSASLRDRIRHALRDIAGHDAQIRFARDSGMTLGIRAAAGSQTLSWSIDTYLDEFGHRIERELDAVKREAEP